MSELQNTIEYIIKHHKNVGYKKTSSGQERLFYINEDESILYCFGPTSYVRRAKETKDSDRIMIVEFLEGPYFQVNDNVYGNKIIKDFIYFEDHGIPVVGMILEEKEHIETLDVENDGLDV